MWALQAGRGPALKPCYETNLTSHRVMKTTPNPLVPQGSLPDKRSKSQVRLYIFTIVAIHAVFLGALLLQGCKRTGTGDANVSNLDTNYPPPPIDPSTPPTPVATQAEAGITSAPPPIDAVATQLTQTPTPTQSIAPPPLDLVPPAVPTLAATEHVVVAGDVYSKIARKYNVTVKALTEANPGVNPTRLKIGQKLAIPAGGASSVAAAPTNGTAQKGYVVKSGDSLMKIARVHGTTVQALRSANHLKTDRITVGQKLVIPGKGAAQDTGVGGTSGAPQTLPAP